MLSIKYSTEVEEGVGLQLALSKRRDNYISFVLFSCFQLL